MYKDCHRCHAQLAGPALRPGLGGDEDRALFCSQCGAPQIMLPEYMRTEVTVEAAGSTTGNVPPPRPQLLDWPVALACGLPVAAVTALLSVLAEARPEVGLLNLFSILAGTGVVLGLYRSRRPLARIDRKVGLRVGLLTGLLMVVAMGIALSSFGVVERYMVHGMAAFDAESNKQQQAGMEMMNQMLGSEPDPERKQLELSYLASPEVRAGSTLFSLSVGAGMVLLLNMACGAFSGALQTRRRPLPRGE